ASCRMGRVNGQWTVNPTWSQIDKGETDMEIFITGTAKAIMMVEGGAREVPEEQVLEAIVRGHNEIKNAVKIVEELRKLTGSKPKREFKAAVPADSIKSEVEKLGKAGLVKALRTKDKHERYDLVDATKKSVVEAMCPDSLKKTDAEAYALKKDSVKTAF